MNRKDRRLAVQLWYVPPRFAARSDREGEEEGAQSLSVYGLRLCGGRRWEGRWAPGGREKGERPRGDRVRRGEVPTLRRWHSGGMVKGVARSFLMFEINERRVRIPRLEAGSVPAVSI